MSIQARRIGALPLARRARARKGFTLIEMMTVITLLAILLALALPSFNGLIERYRVSGRAGALESSLSLARVEAIRRASAVQLKAESGCGATGLTAWSCGWTVRAGNEILRREPQDAALSVEATAGAFEFGAFGQITPWGSFQIDPVGQSSSANAIRLCVGMSGRVRRQSGSDRCDA
ncbi:GspH/FimT family pseudopilin [Variovorax sp. PAMC 28711]|uniref:GspH/FimT family pseudopilin n=1 Tax=Variovorax sp. PAMC 28711 TaxID=1795631 RepID=UPI000AEDF0F1|nr:GspH/FimT family pseudopilin [Variovorax sp. PAMC 28711]